MEEAIPVLVFGAREKGRAVAEILETNGVLVYGFLDDDKTLLQERATYNQVTVLGKTDDPRFRQILGEKCFPFVALEDVDDALKLVTQLGVEGKLNPLNAIHPEVYFHESLRLGGATFIHMGTHIASEVKIQSHCALMGHNMVGHGATLEDFVYLGAGAIVNPEVYIHEGAYIGSGAVLKAGITIGQRAYIAPGSVVLHDVGERTLVAGNPAQPLQQIPEKPKQHANP